MRLTEKYPVFDTLMTDILRGEGVNVEWTSQGSGSPIKKTGYILLAGKTISRAEFQSTIENDMASRRSLGTRSWRSACAFPEDRDKIAPLRGEAYRVIIRGREGASKVMYYAPRIKNIEIIDSE